MMALSDNAAIQHARLVSKRFLRRLMSGGCIVAAGAALSAAAQAQVAPTRVSGLSPFASCAADNVASQPGTNYPDSEIEPWLDVNPTNVDNLIAGWQQDRWSDGGARGLVSGVSIDGGQTWARLVPPGISKCSGGVYDRASDPWVTVSPNGTAYFLSLAFNNNRPDGGGGQNAVLVNRSVNGGVSWGPPEALIVDTDGQVFNDKESMTADPGDSNYVYAAWDRLIDFTLPPGRESKAAIAARRNLMHDGTVLARERMRQLRAAAAQKPAAPGPVFFKGPTVFVRTTNGGASWEPPKVIYDPGNNAQTINNLVEILPGGTVANFFTNIDRLGRARIGIQKSSDKGKTFGPARLPVAMQVTDTGTRTPDSRDPVRDANILFDAAVDHDNGNLYLVWQDSRFGGIDKVAFAMSADSGMTWSAPALIAMTPRSALGLRNQSFLPSVEVGPNHRITVTYYDFRFDKSDGKESTDYFAVFCTPGISGNCAFRGNWGDGIAKLKDVRLTPASFNMLNAPVAGGHFLGDYMGLVRKGGAVSPAFGMADSPNRTSVYTKPIRPRSTAAASAE